MYLNMYSYFKQFQYVWMIYFKELTVEKPLAFDNLDLFTYTNNCIIQKIKIKMLKIKIKTGYR